MRGMEKRGIQRHVFGKSWGILACASTEPHATIPSPPYRLLSPSPAWRLCYHRTTFTNPTLVNPFMNRSEYPRPSLISYRVLTALSWLLVVITSIYYDLRRPTEGAHHRSTIWGQNHRRHTPFAMNPIITSLYWLVLYILQIGYVWHLYSGNSTYVHAAANVGSHFIAHNLLLFGFIHLWCRSHFWLAEMLLIINFANLSAAYFRHSRTPRFIHIPVVSGPLAWNFVALYWCGAAAVNAHSLPARILANIAIWGILFYGAFFLVAYKDYTMGFALSVLSAGEFRNSSNP